MQYQYCIKVRQIVHPYTVRDYVPPDEPSVFLTEDAWIASDLAASLNSSDSENEYYRQPFFPEGDESWRERERKRIQHFKKHGAQTRLYIMDLLRERCPELAARIPEWSCPWVDVTHGADGTAHVHYFNDLEKCRMDAETNSRLGRYLHKVCQDADLDEISESDQDCIAAQITLHGCRIELLTDAHEIEEMYLHSEEMGFGACMSHERGEYVYCLDDDSHPVWAYANSPNMAVAALYRGSRLVARTVVRTDNQVYGKIYGDQYRMAAVLEKDGYRRWNASDPERSFAGGKLTHHVLRDSDEGAVMVLAPYLDVAEYVKEEDGWLVICGPDEKCNAECVDDPVTFHARGTDGAARRTYQCTSCGDTAYWNYEPYSSSPEAPLVVDGDYYCYHCYRDRFFGCIICDEEKYKSERASANGSISYFGSGREAPRSSGGHCSQDVCRYCAEDYSACEECGIGVPCDALCDHVIGADGTKLQVCEACLRYGKKYVSLEHSEKGSWYATAHPGVRWDTANFRYYLKPEAAELEAAAETLVKISVDTA